MAAAMTDKEQINALPSWKIEMIKAVAAHGDFEKGTVMPFLKAFAYDYSLSFGTVNSFYYKALTNEKKEPLIKLVKTVLAPPAKPEAEPKVELEEVKAVENESEKEVKLEEIKPVENPVLKLTDLERLNLLIPDQTPEEKAKAMEGKVEDPVYKKGQSVECEVTEVRTYGALVKTLDGHNTAGLIHISEIKNEFVADVSKHFRFGDRVTAKIVNVDKVKDQLSLSTRGFPVQEYGVLGANCTSYKKTEIPEVNPLADKIAALKDKLPVVVGEGNKSVAVAAAPLQIIVNDEKDQIKTHLNAIVGALTPEAEEALVALIQEHGIFKFTMSMMKAVGDFQPDLGLILMKEIEVALGDRL